jgi:menaquinone-dependent protoporphyrinogen oxidase
VARILLLHSSVYGQSQRICERLQSRLAAAAGHSADVAPLGEGVSLAGHDAVVIGASIRHGKHNPAVLEFVRTNLAVLQSMPSAFFSVSLIARKPTRNTAESNPYVRTFLERSPWKPSLVGVFAGELDYQRYGPFDRYAIRFIMTLTKGPTDLRTKVEFTDWDAVDRFAGRVEALATGQAA